MAEKVSKTRIRIAGLVAIFCGLVFANFMFNDAKNSTVQGFFLFPGGIFPADFVDWIFILGGLFVAGVGLVMVVRPRVFTEDNKK